MRTGGGGGAAVERGLKKAVGDGERGGGARGGKGSEENGRYPSHGVASEIHNTIRSLPLSPSPGRVYVGFVDPRDRVLAFVLCLCSPRDPKLIHTLFLTIIIYLFLVLVILYGSQSYPTQQFNLKN